MKKVILFAMLLLPCGGIAAAQTPGPVLLGTYQNFKAYTQEGNRGRACFVVAAPDRTTPANVRRDPAHLFITHRPKDKIRNEISLQMGYPLKEDTQTSLEIAGGGNFAFAVYNEGAWLAEVVKQDLLVEALRKGREMTVKATSKRGTATTDHYPLSGLGPALDRINAECPK